ncbi:MAG: hypothetical protein CSA94_01580 [Bacteroidetes bacterium]|nr:MAG: hypothetical protein CSA94_01580 [Bacteroidota bacterium]
MRNLIIIGNGFDLAHGLKTSYADFISDLKRNRSKYSNIYMKNNWLINSLDEKDKKWSDLEATYFDILTNMGNSDYINKKYKYSDILNYHNVERFNKDFEILKLCLIKYLKEEQKRFRTIAHYEELFKCFTTEETLFLNFNYTETISRYVRISQIPQIQIHGDLKNIDNPMIFGFAASNEDSKDLLEKKIIILCLTLKNLITCIQTMSLC